VGHPAIDEFCRIYSLQHFQSQTFRRLQRIFRDDVQPLLNERESLLAETATLREQVAALEETVAALVEKAREGKTRRVRRARQTV